MDNEDLLRDAIAADLSALDSNLTLIEKEFHLPNAFGSKGFVDILAKDQYQNYVIIEIKRTKASSRETLQELFKYMGLIRLNFGAKDSEIRAIILSVNWDELFVPFCEMTEQSNLTVDGYRLHTDDPGGRLIFELVKREKLPKVKRDIVSIYQVDLFFTKEKRDHMLAYLIKQSKSIGIDDFVILTMKGDPQYNIMYPFATCYAFNSLTTPQYEEILEKTGELDMEREEFENDEFYRSYMGECILVSLNTTSYNDSLEAMAPESLDSALSEKWQVDGIHRAGIFQADPRLTDDMLLEEMRGLRGSSRVRYIHLGESKQKARIDEIFEGCLKPFSNMLEWSEDLEKCWNFIRSKNSPYRLVIGSHCPESIFYGILQFLIQGNEGYLPSYNMFIDFYEDNILYILEGGLCWNGVSVNHKKVHDFITDERDALFGKAIDIARGSFDFEILPFLGLNWQTGVLVFEKDGIKEGGIAKIDVNGQLEIVDPTARSMTDWLNTNIELKNLLTSIFSKYITSVRAQKR